MKLTEVCGRRIVTSGGGLRLVICLTRGRQARLSVAWPVGHGLNEIFPLGNHFLLLVGFGAERFVEL